MVFRRGILTVIALGLALLGMLLLSIFAGYTPANLQSTFGVAGPVAREQRDLFFLIFWAAVFVFVVVEGALIYVLVRYRDRGEVPKQMHGNRQVEIAWTIAPALVLAVVAVPTIGAVFSLANPPAGDVFEVKAIGHQWWWEFQYPGLGVVTANDLRIPVGETVVVTLESRDVIHSFWVPKLGGKTDVIPGQVNQMWLRADEPGIYYGQCAEFCGTAHAQMRFRVIAESREDLEAWVEGYKAVSSMEFSGKAKEGADLFRSRGCTACHTADGPPGFDQIGPNLTLLGERTTLGAGLIANTPENLARWLRDPGEVKPGNLMARQAPYYQGPGQALSEEEIAALVAYLEGMSLESVK